MDLDRTDKHPPALWDLIQLGYMLHQAQGFAEGACLTSPNNETPGVIEVLQSLLNGLERFELQDSDELARMSLSPRVFRLEMIHETGEKTLGNRVSDLQAVLEELADAIRDESSRRYMYPVTPSKRIDVNRLLNEPNYLFGMPDFLNPPLPTQVDGYLREAGRCLAAGFGPAAFLCILLATEAITRYYFGLIAGAPPAENRTWGQIVAELESPTYQCPPLVLEYLKFIVREHRNPAMHAKLEIDNGMAIDIWRKCARVVQDMITDLLARGLIAAS